MNEHYHVTFRNDGQKLIAIVEEHNEEIIAVALNIAWANVLAIYMNEANLAIKLVEKEVEQ